MSHALHAHTPMLSVVEGRGLLACEITCHRLVSSAAPVLRVTRQRYDPAGRLIASQDPRLPTPNQHTVYSLSGQVLSTDSVDAGWRLALLGDAGQALAGWDSRGSQRQIEYDELLRPVAITEQAQVTERFTYGGPQTAEDNQCNQLTRHDDTAGTVHRPDYGLLGSALTEVRHFLLTLNAPDWPVAVAERNALVEANGLESNWAFDAVGDVIGQTDAMGNTRHFSQTVAGQLKSVSLDEQLLFSEIHYNAFAQVGQQTAGNGVISRSLYDPQDGRLLELRATLTDAFPLQLLKYSYDPAGNILQIEDAAQPVRYFANQRIEPISHYRYDTLYQLIEASGREVKTGASHGPALPDLQNLPPDPNQIANYTQSYEYDAGGNLLQMRHVGAQPFTRVMRVAPNSNRSLPKGELDFEAGFDANGNLQQLVRGQDLSWDARNQLRHITTVQRDDGPNDGETYVYDGGGQRCRKISVAQASNRTFIDEVRYLPGLEIRTDASGEMLHVISVNNVRLLHWQAGKPDDIANDQLRHSLSDHLGSSTLELDAQGALLSQESYYPFGGTAWWAARSVVEAKYKTVRYSGKERDASGLYYYGFRYYAPWLQRWINPDPAGDVDGLNYYAFVSNCPTTRNDRKGETGEKATTSKMALYHVEDKHDVHKTYEIEPIKILDARPGALWGDPSEILELPYQPKLNLFFSPRLQQNLQMAAYRAGTAETVVKTKFIHTAFNQHEPYTIISTATDSDDMFVNTYLPEKWIFTMNFKTSGTREYYASDIVRSQYKTISTKMGFYGVLPSLIINSSVVNKTTQQVTANIPTRSPELLQRFLYSTPNGKRTQRVLDDFGLEAQWVDRKMTSFYVSVLPKSSSSLHQ